MSCMQKENTPPQAIRSPTFSPGQQSPAEAILITPNTIKAHRPPTDPRSSSDRRTSQSQKRRRSAAEWIESMTGTDVGSGSDSVFRAQLRNGVLLCQLMNKIRPGCITHVSILLLSYPC